MEKVAKLEFDAPKGRSKLLEIWNVGSYGTRRHDHFFQFRSFRREMLLIKTVASAVVLRRMLRSSYGLFEFKKERNKI